MNEFDGRKISRKVLEAIRIRAVKRVEAGESPEAVIKTLGITRPRIYEWIAKYREGGIEALKSKKATGRPPKLADSDLQKIYKTVVGKNPMQLKFEFALWTRAMVREYIRREFKVSLSEVSVGRLLKKLGFSPQRPIHKVYQQDEVLALEWRAKDFPEIKRLAKAENAEILLGDECSIRSDYHSGTIWAKKVKTTVVVDTGGIFKVNLISAIGSKGTLRFMATEENVTGTVFITFLKRLITNARNPIFLIVDNHPIHRCKEVLQFVQQTEGKLRLFYLPPYPPKLNSDEMVWNYLINNRIFRQIVRHGWDLYKGAGRIMRPLQKMPDKIISFFRLPDHKTH